MPDATNMLGGIGDVLQARPTGANIDHLGHLARVACFDDDAQIRQIQYQWVESADVGYLVILRQVGASTPDLTGSES
jgi:hypothetical protein